MEVNQRDTHTHTHTDTRGSLEQYRLLTAYEMGQEFGEVSYAIIVEVDYKSLRCAGKKIHCLLYEGQVDNLIRRFEEECRLLSQLRHPHIVQFLGIYSEADNNVPVLVMEFLPLPLLPSAWTTMVSCLKRSTTPFFKMWLLVCGTFMINMIPSSIVTSRPTMCC